MDSNYCQYMYKNFKTSVVWIGGINVYVEIPISNIERITNEKE